MTAVWVAVAYDLINKYRELAGHGDAEADDFIEKWDRARNHNNVQQLLKLEGDLLDHASKKLQLLEPIELRDLSRLQQDRHLSAHPAFSSEAELFEPTSELVRLHIVNAIELLLSQRPVQGRTLLTEFDRDIVSPGFPTDPGRIADYFEQRYLARTRSSTITNFGSVLAKALLRREPAAWQTVKDKVANCLCCVRERRPAEWAAVETDLVRLINELDPDLRLNALRVLALFPELVDRLEQATVTVVQQNVENYTPAPGDDLSLCGAISIDVFRPAIEGLLRRLESPEFAHVVASVPSKLFWPIALERYVQSGSFRSAETNFSDLIAPFRGLVDREDLDSLFRVIPQNNQIYDAARTPALLLEFLRAVGPRATPSQDAKTELYAALKDFGPWVFDSYDELWPLLTAEGWEIPAENGA